MKIKKGIDYSELEKYGFKLTQDEDDYTIHDEICYEIGHSRRGQYYYYIIDSDRCVRVYGSKPDGSGGSIALDDVIFQMFKDGVLVLDAK
jgi:hypothetical protein